MFLSFGETTTNNEKEETHTNNKTHAHIHKQTDASKMPIEKEKKECYWPPPIVIALRINKKSQTIQFVCIICIFVHVHLLLCFLFLFWCKFYYNNIFDWSCKKPFQFFLFVYTRKCWYYTNHKMRQELWEEEQCLYESLLCPIQYPDEHSFKSVINQFFVVIFLVYKFFFLAHVHCEYFVLNENFVFLFSHL